MVFHRRLNHISDGQISDLAIEEFLDCPLICRVAAAPSGFVCQGKSVEIFKIRRFKGNLCQLCKIQPVARQEAAFRIIQRILDRKLHIRRAELRYHRAVLVFYH